MSMGIAFEPVCPAMIEAAAIVGAEWMRLRPPGEPACYVTCERPAPRTSPRTLRAKVTTRPRPPARPWRRADLRLRWPVSMVWARERSPPARG
ncbi:hypothetical protein [Mycobacterium palustre]|nr:hypothetical protein [Mycobacterium palustre]MCV7099851.1 hypothetical protein [Mycobacterium palustre]